MPKTSVIMSTFRRNHGSNTCKNYLKRAIDSIINQTFIDWELVLLDDASTDGSQEVCQAYADKDKRIRYFRFDKNSNCPAKMYNMGMLLANANLFCFMFDDDQWFTNCLQDLHDGIEQNKEYGMIYAKADYSDSSSGNALKGFGSEWNYANLKTHNFLCNFSVIVKREVINAVGGYSEHPDLRRLCDWHLWLRIGEKYKVKRIDKVIGYCDGGLNDSVGINYKLVELGNVKQHEIPLKNRLSKPIEFSLVYSGGLDAALKRWQVDYLKDALNSNGITTKTYSASEISRVPTSFFSMFYRTSDEDCLGLMKASNHNGSYVIYSIDDFIFQKNCKFKDNRNYNQSFLEASLFVSPSKELCSKFPNNKPTIVRKNGLDLETFKLLSDFKKDKSEPPTIGWLTSAGRKESDEMVKNLLAKLDIAIDGKYKIKFIMFGNHNIENEYRNIIVKKLDNIDCSDPEKLYETYKTCNFDIVINPLPNDEFFACKSELKLIETGALGVPLIASNIKPFSEVIENNKNGILCNNEDDFVNSIVKLLKDKNLSKTIGKNARNFVKNNYLIDNIAKKFIVDLLETIWIMPKTISSAGIIGKLAEVDKSHAVGPISPNSLWEIITKPLESCSINKISIYGGTYERKITNGIKTRVSIGNKLIYEGFIDSTQMKDNDKWVVYNGEPIEIKEGQNLIIGLINITEHSLAIFPCKHKVSTCRSGPRIYQGMALILE